VAKVDSVWRVWMDGRGKKKKREIKQKERKKKKKGLTGTNKE